MLPAVRKFEFRLWKMTEMRKRPEDDGQHAALTGADARQRGTEVLADAVGGDLVDRGLRRDRRSRRLVVLDVPGLDRGLSRLGHLRAPLHVVAATASVGSGARCDRPVVM